MARAAKACSQPDCPHLQPCPLHPKIAWAGSNRRAELPPDWNQTRERILQRDPICTECHAAPASEVHHTGGKHDHRDEMLAGVCSPCHKRETAAQAARARNR